MSRKKRKQNKQKPKFLTKPIAASENNTLHTDLLFNKALKYHQTGDFEKAENAYRNILQINQNHFDSLHMLGVLAYEVKHYDAAITLIHRATTVNPNFPHCYSNLGAILYDIGRPEDAVKCYKKAIELKPDFAKAYNNLSLILNYMGEFDSAINCCLKAIEIDSDYHEAYGNLAYFYEITNRLNDAHKAASKALFYDIKMPMANLVAAKYERRKGKPEQALKHIDMIDMHTVHSSVQNIILYEKGLLYDRLKKYDNAYKCFSEANQILSQRMIDHITSLGFLYPDDLSQLDPGIIEDLQNIYYSNMSKRIEHNQHSLVMDKLPLNIIHIGLINRVFPESKIILALRHPADACISCFMQNFKLNEAMVHFLNLADTTNLYCMVMDLWATYVKYLNINFHIIKYEDLVTEFDYHVNNFGYDRLQ